MFNNIDDDLLKVHSGKSELYICPKKNDQNDLLKGVLKFFYSIDLFLNFL